MKTKKRLLGIILSGLLTLSPPIQYVSYAENADQTEDIASDGISSSEISYSGQDIKDNEISLAEIAEMTGFSDTGYFCKVFKKFTGMPPNHYRQGGTS